MFCPTQTLQMGIYHFSGLFVLLCLGLGSALLSLLGEHVFYRLALPRIRRGNRLQYWLHTSQVRAGTGWEGTGSLPTRPDPTSVWLTENTPRPQLGATGRAGTEVKGPGAAPTPQAGHFTLQSLPPLGPDCSVRLPPPGTSSGTSIPKGRAGPPLFLGERWCSLIHSPSLGVRRNSSRTCQPPPRARGDGHGCAGP